MAHDLLKTLHMEHEELMDVMKKMHKAKTDRERTTHLQHVREMLLPHLRAEEEVIYPALMREDGEARERALEAQEEHQAARHILDQINNTDAQDERFKAKTGVLKDMLKHHVETEETDIFDDLEDIFSDKELDKMKEQFITAKEATKSTVR